MATLPGRTTRRAACLERLRRPRRHPRTDLRRAPQPRRRGPRQRPARLPRGAGADPRPPRGAGGLAVQAATGLLAVIVLLVVMNWFFHKVYWTGWIQNRNKHKRAIL